MAALIKGVFGISENTAVSKSWQLKYNFYPSDRANEDGTVTSVILPWCCPPGGARQRRKNLSTPYSTPDNTRVMSRGPQCM